MPTAPSLVGLDVLLISSPSRSSCNVDKKCISLAQERARYSVTWMAEKKVYIPVYKHTFYMRATALLNAVSCKYPEVL